MNKDEFEQACRKCAAEILGRDIPEIDLTSANDKKTEPGDWLQAQVSCYGFSDAQAAKNAIIYQISRAAAGNPVGFDHYDAGKTLLVIAPNEEIDNKIREALGKPKFSKPLFLVPRSIN